MIIQHMGISSAVKQMFADEPKIAVTSGRSAAAESEAFGGIERESKVSVVEVRYCYCWGMGDVSCLPNLVYPKGLD